MEQDVDLGKGVVTTYIEGSIINKSVEWGMAHLRYREEKLGKQWDIRKEKQTQKELRNQVLYKTDPIK